VAARERASSSAACARLMRIHLGSPGRSSEPTERLAMHPIVLAARVADRQHDLRSIDGYVIEIRKT
jgi:hypothetical protein